LWGKKAPNNDNYGDRRVFGIGRRACPATKLSMKLGPEVLKVLQERYTIELLNRISPSGHGATESPRPRAMAKVR
jgi:hypothetical protein